MRAPKSFEEPVRGMGLLYHAATHLRAQGGGTGQQNPCHRYNIAVHDTPHVSHAQREARPRPWPIPGRVLRHFDSNFTIGRVCHQLRR